MTQHPCGRADHVEIDLQILVECGRGGNEEARGVTQQRHGHDQARHQQHTAAGQNQQTARDGAEQDGEKGSGLDHRVAGDQFIGMQVLRQDRVLDRAEQRRLCAHQKQHRHQRPDVLAEKRRRRAGHDHHFGGFDEPRQLRLVETIGQLSSGGAEEKER